MSELVVCVSSAVLSATAEWCPVCLLPAAERVVVALSLNGVPNSVVEAVVCDCSEESA